MLLRFGTRTFIKSLLISAGLPAILAAQNPYTLPTYPQSSAGMPTAYVVPGAGSVPVSIPISGGGAVPGNVPQVQTTRPSTIAPPNISAPAGSMVDQPLTSSMPNSVPAPGIGPGYNAHGFMPQPKLVSNSVFVNEPTISTAEAFNPPNAQLASCQSCGPETFGHGYSGSTTSFASPQFSGGINNGYLDSSCNGLPWCDGPSNSGFFVSLEALLFFANKPAVTTFGDEASERVVNVNGVTYRFENSLDSSWLSNDGAWGQRLEFGNVNQDCGWFASIWNVKQAQTYSTFGVSYVPADPDGLMRGFVDGNGDGFDDDLNGNNIYGRSGEDLGTLDAGPPPSFVLPFDGTPDVGAPIDTNDMITWLQTFNNVTSSNKLTMINAELNRLYRVAGHSWSNEIDYYYGIRYLQIKDIYNITANGGFLDQSVWNAESDNNLIGPQIGMRWSKRTRAVGFSVDGRFFAAYNRQDNDLRGYTGSNFAANGAANNPAALTSESFVDSFGNDAFSPTGELRADMILKMSRSWAFKVGYTGLVVGDVSRSSPKIVYAIPRSSLRDVESDTTLISHGVNFGLEYNR